MKKLLLTLALLLPLTLAFSQKKTAMEGEKTKVYTLMGKSWMVTKYQDGTKIYEWEINEEDYQNHRQTKPSRFETNFIEPELGINLWPVDQGAPEVKPWGSWYFAMNTTGTWKPSRNFRLKSALGVNWYNFKFEDTDLIAVKTPEGLDFQEFTDGMGTKSKISASFVNLTLVPSIQTNDGNLRFGLGGYAGLRIGGRGKYVYEDENGDKTKLFEKSNMYVDNFRYGLRSEIGVGEVSLFFNYDLNDLFQPGRGPELQAMSFGILLTD
ncbi:hypothetical protein [Algoriphagus confluentis]|uniref:Outer membrane protein beta-barrel domain-containing protein n=1 Tax=Algoriphagus confluentis TaxID=1697556 RepID=A0ABQ6PSA0_9BACT|nr:hypothetical protein Aconfl_34490 [Algoriphagus confluentis]